MAAMIVALVTTDALGTLPAEAQVGVPIPGEDGTSPWNLDGLDDALDEERPVGDDSRSWTSLMLTGAIAAAIGATAGTWFERRRQRTATTGRTSTAPAPTMPTTATVMPPAVHEPVSEAELRAPVDPNPPVDPSAADRTALIAALIDLADVVPSAAVRTQITEHLATVGVVPVEVPDGTPFDPDHHRGIQATAAPDPTRDGTVASCDRVGWTDHGTLLRPPEVVVHRWEDPR